MTINKSQGQTLRRVGVYLHRASATGSCTWRRRGSGIPTTFASHCCPMARRASTSHATSSFARRSRTTTMARATPAQTRRTSASAMRRRPTCLTKNPQCSGFTGIIPVWTVFLITNHWYWSVVYKVVWDNSDYTIGILLQRGVASLLPKPCSGAGHLHGPRVSFPAQQRRDVHGRPRQTAREQRIVAARPEQPTRHGFPARAEEARLRQRASSAPQAREGNGGGGGSHISSGCCGGGGIIEAQPRVTRGRSALSAQRDRRASAESTLSHIT